jgi:hypothetical protein
MTDRMIGALGVVMSYYKQNAKQDDFHASMHRKH